MMEGSEARGPRDLVERTFVFARDVRAFVKQVPKSISNIEDIRQLVRASGSVAGNYIEAKEACSKKDYLLHIKICRKEARESRLWLRLLDCGGDSSLSGARDSLAREAHELTLIFSAIVLRGSSPEGPK
jgi:four helix bundle protein